MKKLVSILSLLLILSMLLGAFASCNVPEQQTNESESDSIETPTDNEGSETKGEDETGSDGESDSTIIEPIELEGNFADSILYADEIKNGVQAYYPDGVARDTYYVENLNMSAEFDLLADSEQKVKYIKNTKGQSYLENTMDVYIRMADGKTYFASESPGDARSNTYRIGYYYYDVRTLEQSFYTNFTVADEIVWDLSTVTGYNSNCISAYKATKDSIKYVVSASDPYFYVESDEGFPSSEWDAVQITCKTTGTTQGQLFMSTSNNTAYSAAQSMTWPMQADGEFHTYTLMLDSIHDYSGDVLGLRFDIGVTGEVVEVTEIKIVDLESDAPYVLLDRTWHTYSDKVHQELHFTAPDGQQNIAAMGMVTEIAADTVDKLVVKDATALHYSLDGVDWATAEYIGFDIKNVGIFGYIMPYDNKSGTITVTVENGNYVIVQEYVPENNEIRPPYEVGDTSNDAYFGHRLYTDENHTFDEFLKEADWERNPLKGIASSNIYHGYDALRGAYTFAINGTGFNTPFHSSWNRHYTTSVTIKPRDKGRKIYIRTATDSGCLEGAALLDADGMVLPIPLEVSKNFGEGEEPVMNYGDETYGETVFPLVVSQGKECEFQVVNIYQNWGNFPIKQLSSIAYYAPYYHLSIGVTETSCISPWYVRGRTLWTLPDFRSVSAPYWHELPGNSINNQPQHTHAETPTIVQYTDAEGNWYASENIKNTVLSYGPIYAEVAMDYISDDGRMEIKYTHLEMPQTDELRACYEVEFEILEDISFNDFKNDFSFYGFGSNETRLSYVNEDNEIEDRSIASFKDTKQFILGDEAPFFCLYDKRTDGKRSSNSANFGLLLKEWDIVIGGEQFDGNFIVVNKGTADYHLSLNLEDVTLKAGDHIYMDIVVIAWGSHLSTDSSNMVAMRENTCLDPYTLTAIDGEVIESAYLPRFKSTNGESAEFTISGGANNAAIRVYGFDKLTAPKIYEKIDGEWVPYQVSSINNPDKTGNMHYYDGYMTYYDGDGTYSYAFVVNMDNVESRTFKVEAKDDFVRWPKVVVENNDPINLYLDPTELSAVFTTEPGVTATVSDDATYVRFEGTGSAVGEVFGDVFSNVQNIPTGQYIVIKYRSPSTNTGNYFFQFFTSTVNSSVTGSDYITSGIVNDDAWHIDVIDMSTYKTETFIPSGDGLYYATHMRFDVFNHKMAEGQYIDVAYVGLCDSIEKLIALNKEGDVETLTVSSKTKTEVYNIATGELESSEEEKVPVVVPDTVTMTRDFESFIDPENAQGYSAGTDIQYFGRIDSLCGYGPGGTVGQAYNSKGSNSAEGVAVFDYGLTTTTDCRLVFAGWNLIWGGVEKYVWSADGGKTWNDIECYKGFKIGSAYGSMPSYPANKFGGSEENWKKYVEFSCYQGSQSGPAAATGIAADLTPWLGQTVDVTFAAVPKSDTTKLCILAHVKGVKVTQTIVEVSDGDLGTDTGTVGGGVTALEKDTSKFIDPSNAQGYKASDVRYFGRIDTLCGYGPDLEIGATYNFKGSSTANGVAIFAYDGQTCSNSMMVFAGWSLAKGGIEKYVWSADGGKTWNDVELVNRSGISAAGSSMISFANSVLGRTDYDRWATNSSYQGSTRGPESASGLGADLSAYVGQTVEVTFAAVPVDAPDTLCILAHVTGVEVIGE